MEIEQIRLKIVESTNQWSLQHLTTFNQNKITLVTAEEQTAGIGQYGKKWFSPPHVNLYASYCLFVRKISAPLFYTTLMSQAAKSTLEDLNVNATIKFPNDLLVKDKKIAGILTHTTPLTPVIGVVIGIGININMSEDQLISIDQPATSLYLETGKQWKIDAIIERLNFHFLAIIDVHSV